MRVNVSLSLILLTALGFRLVSLNQSLWLDEAIQAQAVITNSLPSLITDYFPNDFNPPLSYLISWIVVRLLGESEVWLRLPSVLLGVANVWLVYNLAQEILPKIKFSVSRVKFTAAQLAALLLATAPLHIYYSQEARPYMLATFLATWSMLELWRLMNNETKQWWCYCLVTTLMLYSHYLAWLLLPAQGLIVIWGAKKPAVQRWAISVGGMGLLLMPWLPILVMQLRTGAGVANALPVWRQLGELSAKNLGLIPVKFLLGRISISNDFIYGLIGGLLILGISILLAITLVQYKKEIKQKRLLWLWLITPLVTGALLSIKVPVFQYFRFLFVLPAFYLLIVWGISSLPEQLRTVLAGGLLLVNIVSSGVYLFNSQFHREDWRSAVAFIHQRSRNPKVIILKPVEAPFWYYDRGRSETVDYTQVDKIRFEKRVWLIAYAQPIFEPEDRTEQRLRQYGFKEVETRDFHGVGIKYLVNPAGLTANRK